MLFSMTGFGRAIDETSGKKITVEIKSLNSKQLDLTVRLPQSYREYETHLRGMVAHHLQRGKCDLIITVESMGDTVSMQFNMTAMKAYKKQFIEMSQELNIPEPSDWYNLLLRFPDSVKSDSSDEISDEEIASLYTATQKAIDALMAHRREEGKHLEEFFTLRVNKIKAYLDTVPKFETERVEKIRSRIEENLSMLPSAEYDKSRFEQEMIFYIEKLDISEEKQRLAQHLRYFLETMDEQEGGQGKKLGFISQEMGREINTLGSKSNHADLQKLVVMMKDELEQIKEQVLNVM